MPKKPKCDEGEKKETWADDQEVREYYYDDAHGYEVYKPEEEEAAEDAEIERRGDAEIGPGSDLT